MIAGLVRLMSEISLAAGRRRAPHQRTRRRAPLGVGRPSLVSLLGAPEDQSKRHLE